MKRGVVVLLATGVLASATAAAAQPWAPIRDREGRLEMRIDRGMSDGSLTRREAGSLRNELRQLTFLEDRYRRDGLSGWERADLDRRFDNLSGRIFSERRDRQDRLGYGYGPVNPYR